MTTTIQKLARFITSPDYALDTQSRATVCDALIDTLHGYKGKQPYVELLDDLLLLANQLVGRPLIA